MRSLLTAVPGLGCALMMAGMMWLMSRGNKSRSDGPVDRRADDVGQEAQLDDLRSEIERLRAELHASDQPTPADGESAARPDADAPVAGERTPGAPPGSQGSG